MGMIDINFEFNCVDDNGIDLSKYGSAWQDMDAFIGYGGKGKEPPWLICVDESRNVTCAFTGQPFDPKAFGNEDNEAWPMAYGPKIGYAHIVIESGKATKLRLVSAEEYYGE